MSLLNDFERFGIEADAVPGWLTRGHLGIFTPNGILLGSGMDLDSTLAGKPGLAGPLANFHIDHTGKLTALARRISHCAGKGSGVVLGELRRGHPIRRNAAMRDLADNTNGDSYFFGIMLEVETDVTIEAASLACAALCSAFRWSHNRVINARSWTKRRTDLAYKGDIWAGVSDVLSKAKA